MKLLSIILLLFIALFILNNVEGLDKRCCNTIRVKGKPKRICKDCAIWERCQDFGGAGGKKCVRLPNVPPKPPPAKPPHGKKIKKN
ncbi:hypothetical protein Mgra_00004150 [Meloidogyne graminicola]|uniref:Uncharacterized protein n=1 Tax=Meloidogyne graminicola TaxID=189291 RepID=A0A8S9ZSA8_9BILA|nr:hypothetical protein Mgra_00004150 [Meloidogyne graminicola]